MTKRFQVAAKLAAAAVALLLVATGPAPAADPVKIRIGWIAVPSTLVPILFDKEGIVRHAGHSYVIEPIHFAGSSPMITALASGDLEIGELAYSSFGYAIQNAHLDDLHVIADEIQDGAGDYHSNAFMVLKDGPIKTIEDLKGKVVATNVIGAGVDIGMRAMLRRHGLVDKRDYTVIESDYAHMKAMLADHKADMMSTATTFAFAPDLRAMVRDLFTLKDAMGTTQLLSWSARAGFIARNRPAMVDFMEDVLRSLHWYLDPANHDEAVAIVARFVKQPPERFDWAFTGRDLYRDPNLVPNLAAMQGNLDTQKELGFLTVAVDVAKHADLTIVKEAAERLK